MGVIIHNFSRRDLERRTRFRILKYTQLLTRVLGNDIVHALTESDDRGRSLNVSAIDFRSPSVFDVTIT